MKKDLHIFKNQEFGQVRWTEFNNKPYVVGVDIARALGYSNPSKAIIQHCKGITKTGIPSSGGIQETNIIPEGDIYRLIAKSELPSAERFESWIFDEVLPGIRKHGAYMTPQKIEEVLLNPDTIIQLATNLKVEQERRLQAEKQIEQDKPKVLFAEAVENSEDVILVKEMALILTQQGFKIGQNQLFEYLRMYGYLCKKIGDMYNLPTKKYEHLFKVTKRTIQHTDRTSVRNTPKITGKGQLYFIRKFAEYKLKGLTIKNLFIEDAIAN